MVCVFLLPLLYNLEIGSNTEICRHSLIRVTAPCPSPAILAINTSFLPKNPVLEEGRRLALDMCCHRDAVCLHLDMQLRHPKARSDGAWKYCDLAASHSFGTWKRSVLAPSSSWVRWWQKLGPGTRFCHTPRNVLSVP